MFEGGYVSANVLPLITITCDRYWFVGNGERLILHTDTFAAMLRGNAECVFHCHSPFSAFVFYSGGRWCPRSAAANAPKRAANNKKEYA